MVDPTSKRQPTLADRLVGLARAVGRLNTRVDTLEATPSSSAWGGITGALADQADLQAALDSKAATAHGHVIADVTGLQAALNAKQAAGSYQPLATVLTNTTASFTTAQETKLGEIAAGATKNGFGTATIDFGAFPGSNEASVAFTNADVGAAVNPFFASDDTTTDHTANDHKYAAMLVQLSAQTTPGVGGAIHARSEHKMQGTFDVRYGY